jgi:chromosome segregation ATPase
MLSLLNARRFLVGIAGTALAVGLLFGTNALSYVRTAGKEVRTAANDAIPAEFKLQTARDMLSDEVEPQLREMKHVVAEGQVEVERLTTKLEERAIQVAKLRDKLNERYSQYESGEPTVTIGNVSYSRDQVKQDMDQRYSDVKVLESTLESEKEVLTAKKAALAENEKKIGELLRAREDLGLRIQELEARVSAVEAQATIAQSEFDESALKNVRALLDSVEKKVDVQERELTMSLKSETAYPIPSSDESAGPSVDEISAYLGRPTANSAIAVTE